MRQGKLFFATASVFVLAACGSSSGGNTSTAQGGGSSAASGAVATKSVSGLGMILVDSSGMALYTPDVESSGQIKCVDDCVKIWIPVKTTAGATLSSDSNLASHLTAINRPDGSAQVAFDGQPLYTFFQDKGPGVVSGQGAADDFSGTHFVWSVETPSGVSTGTSSPGGGGGYHY